MEATLIIILGAIAPFLVAVISRVAWSSTTKQLVAWGISLVLGILWIILTGGFGAFTLESFVASVPVIYALSQAVYEFLLKNVLGKIEAATDKSAVVVTPDVDNANNVVVTSNETIEVATKNPEADANVIVDAPIEITTVNPDNEPRG